ncbi:oxidoreductase [Rhizobium leguminosarum]|uniref:oxidoreductase n=1 Tax=Rhizobium leguminosarum TaxID=384 RepID=UPI000FEC9742|nr:oxidoreductase [Rhizobium leguminosarum]RWX40806.1 oxidoreductase [Rhizobium leguminosarum]
MPPIPKPTPSTQRAIQDALESGHDEWESVGVPAGDIGVECDRAIWLAFRRASIPEHIDWRKRRIFERGNIEEERLLDLLRLIGCEVWGQQDRVRAVGGHLRGKIDGRVLGLIEAPKKEHVFECKSAKEEYFKPVKKNGVKVGMPKHYATFQFYMYGLGLDRVYYMMSNKNDEDLHLERVPYDPEFAMRQVARIERIINMPEPPSRMCTKRDDFRGVLCRQAAVCWGEVRARSHCRTCIHSSPLMDGNAGWDCARWSKPLSLDEQDAGCPAMLYIPALMIGYEQIDCDEEAETITYRSPTGDIYVDGASKEAA